MKRVNAVKEMRLKSPKVPTQQMAFFPTLFGENRQPEGPYLLVPAHTSETRVYVPIGYMSSGVVCSKAAFMIPDTTPFHFGVLSSIMHMVWVRAVCGRIKSDYRYSAGIVYNNFPWPDPTDKQRAAIEAGSAAVLAARSEHPDASLADLYDPLAMPESLVKAHQLLDRAVDVAYGRTAWKSEAERVVFLFGLYDAAVSIFPMTKTARKRSSKVEV